VGDQRKRLIEQLKASVSSDEPANDPKYSGLLEEDYLSKILVLHSTALVCDASSVTEGQKSIVVTPLSPSFVGLEQVRLSVRVLPVLSILCFSVSIKHINQASAPGTLAVIKFCAYVLIDSVSSEKCVSSNSSG